LPPRDYIALMIKMIVKTLIVIAVILQLYALIFQGQSFMPELGF
jgi:hypothetical protein